MRLSWGVLNILLVAGCGGDDAVTSSGTNCAAYLSCLKQVADQSGQSAAYTQAASLYGSASACNQSSAAMQACETACQQAITALNQTGSSCSSPQLPVKDGGGGGDTATTPKETCEKYLACVAVASPTEYGPEVALYGDGSACWANATQSAGCEKACEAASTNYAAQCNCVGTSCTKCQTLPSGYYQVSQNENLNCGLSVESVDFITNGTAASLMLQTNGFLGANGALKGSWMCEGPTTFSVALNGSSCTGTMTATVTQGTGTSYQLTVTVSGNCVGSTPCSQTVLLTPL